jgi:hypothetical protein
LPGVGIERSLEVGAVVSEVEIEAKIWTGGREYSVKKTIKQLAVEAQDRV